MAHPARAAVSLAGALAIAIAMMPQGVRAQVTCTDAPPPQQTALPRPILLGTSGGNINSSFRYKGKSGCSSGTLGSMVEDADDNEYVLSNNHVLADQNEAKPGQLILQPGLVDVQCLKAQSNAVATFSRTVKLKFGSGKNYVDAAIAAVDPGQVSPYIMFVGGVADTVVDSPDIGMPVQKMGRTSCLTTGIIAALDANVRVNYSDNPKKPKYASFVDQILVTGSVSTPTFGAPGDSGSLIVTLGDCPQAVALLFAGTASGLTIANPIPAVLSKLSVSMVGTCDVGTFEPAQSEALAADVGVSAAVVKSAAAVRDRHEHDLMNIPGAAGTGIAASDVPGQPAIEVYLEQLTAQAQAAAPRELEGVAVKLVQSGEISAY